MCTLLISEVLLHIHVFHNLKNKNKMYNKLKVKCPIAIPTDEMQKLDTTMTMYIVQCTAVEQCTTLC